VIPPFPRWLWSCYDWCDCVCAFSHIKAGSELTWDYSYEVGSVPDKVLYCYCGSSECRGRLLWLYPSHKHSLCVPVHSAVCGSKKHLSSTETKLCYFWTMKDEMTIFAAIMENLSGIIPKILLKKILNCAENTDICLWVFYYHTLVWFYHIFQFHSAFFCICLYIMFVFVTFCWIVQPVNVCSWAQLQSLEVFCFSAVCGIIFSYSAGILLLIFRFVVITLCQTGNTRYK